MRNSKKLIAVIMTVALLASMMVPALAATNQSEADKLLAVGLLRGSGTGGLDLESDLTRAQGIILTVRAMGAEAAALAMTSGAVALEMAKVNDASDIPYWAASYAAYAVKNNITNGTKVNADLTITFSPSNPLSGKQFIIMMLRSLGYTGVTLENCIEKALAAGMLSATKVVAYAMEDQITRDDAAYIIYSTVNNGLVAIGGVTPSAIKLVSKLVADGAISATAAAANFTFTAPTATAAPAFAVAAVSALNMKQVSVTFNQAVDATKGADEANYKIAGAAPGDATILADGKTVVLTLALETKMLNATDVEVKVLTGSGLAADYTATIRVVDSTIPTLVSVKATGLKTLVLTFSEPVYDAGGDAVALETDLITVKSGIYTYTVSGIKADYANSTLTVTTGTNLVEGVMTIKLNAMGMSDGNALRDFAGLVLIPQDFSFTYAKDTSVASATITSVALETKKATVTFSKMVFGANVMLYHSVNGIAAYGTALVTKTEANASDTWEFEFTNAIPSGAITFFLVSADVAADQITDLFGVKVPDQSFAFTVIADVIAPTVSAVTVNASTSIDVQFSEDVDTASVLAANFELKKADGTVVAPTVALKPASTDTVRLTIGLVDNETYTVTVKAMKDKALNSMAAAYSTQALVADNTNPTATAYITDAKTIYVVYSEAMNNAAISARTNYLVKSNELVDADTLTVISPTKVKIVYNAGGLAATNVVTIGAVTDLAGKKLTTNTTFSTAVAVTADELTFTAELTAVNKVKLTFNKQLATFDSLDFTIAGAAWYSIESNTVVDSVSVIVLVLDTDLAASATPVVTAAGVATTSTEGTILKAAAVTAADKIAPTISSVVYVSATRMDVVFTEALDATLFAGAGMNGFSVANGGTLTSALVTADSTIVTLTGTDFVITTDVAYNGTNGLKDVAGNTLAAASIIADATAAAITVVNAVADNTFTITTNFYATALVVGEVDMDIAAGIQATKAINGQTFTATVAAGVATITSTVAATATAVATTTTFTITKAGIVKTVTMVIPATVATVVGPQPTIAGQ